MITTWTPTRVPLRPIRCSYILRALADLPPGWRALAQLLVL